MIKTRWGLCSMLAAAGLLAVGCGASSDSTDGASDAASSTTTDAAGDAATDAPPATLFGLTTGDSCFDVETVASVTDGCDIAPGGVVGGAEVLAVENAASHVDCPRALVHWKNITRRS